MGRNPDLHGSAPDDSPVALLIIDMINAFEFEGAEAMFPRALAAAQAIAELKRRARRAGVPAIYVNDNFGKWRSDLRKLLEHCLSDGVRGQAIARLLEPGEDGVLFTAHDAYMRDYHLVVPSDCVASQTAAEDRYALQHMAAVTKADVRPSGQIDFARLGT